LEKGQFHHKRASASFSIVFLIVVVFVQYSKFITAILRITLVLCTGEPLVLTHSQYDKVVVDLADLAPSNKKSVIHVLHVDDDPSLQEITKLMLLDLDSGFEIDNACLGCTRWT
jgi:hypothetical protein